MKFLLERNAAIIAAEPGVGKTSISLGALRVLKDKGMFTRALIIAPLKPAHLVWPAEVEKWIEFNDFKLNVLHGKTKNVDLIYESDICVINPEGLDWLVGAERSKSPITGRVRVVSDLRGFREFGFDILIVDELTRFKHHMSGRSKVLRSVINTFQRRWGLTGSLVANGLEDLFGQMLVIDGGRTFGQAITHYRNQYFVPNYSGFGYHLAEGAEEKIRKAAAPTILSLKAKGLPEPVDRVHYIDLPPDVRKLYDEFEEEFFAEFSGNSLVAATKGVAMGKCRQIAAGGIYVEELEGRNVPRKFKSAHIKLGDRRTYLRLHNEKAEYLEGIVNELQGSPLLVGYEFSHDLHRLMEHFKEGVPFYSSKIENLKEIEDRWNAGNIPLLFGNPMSMAHGLNLQKAGNHLAWYTMTWDYELYDQFVRRVWRQGNQSAQVYIHHILARDTVDELLYATKKRKAAQQESFVDAFIKYKRKRGG
jgi:hypothetical protein